METLPAILSPFFALCIFLPILVLMECVNFKIVKAYLILIFKYKPKISFTTISKLNLGMCLKLYADVDYEKHNLPFL